MKEGCSPWVVKPDKASSLPLAGSRLICSQHMCWSHLMAMGKVLSQPVPALVVKGLRSPVVRSQRGQRTGRTMPPAPWHQQICTPDSPQGITFRGEVALVAVPGVLNLLHVVLALTPKRHRDGPQHNHTLGA